MSNQIYISDRCFFPLGAWLSSRKLGCWANRLGYRGLELHPTWRVWWEMKRLGHLTCPQRLVSLFHISWRDDGKNDGHSWLKRTFLVPPYQVFPPQLWAWQTLRQLEARYAKQVVNHWVGDLFRYRRPILELHSQLGVGPRQLQELVKSNKIQGIVLDTKKFPGWLTRHRLGPSLDRVLKRLSPHIIEVHLRFGTAETAVGKPMAKAPGFVDLKRLIALGWQGRIVVEAGWPEAEMNLWRWAFPEKGWQQFHQQVTSMLQKLSY